MPILNVGPSDYDTIAEAMLVAQDGDTILIAEGFAIGETADVTSNSLTISGDVSSTGIVLQLQPGILSVTLAGTAPINVLDSAGAPGTGNAIVGNDGENVITVSGGVDAVSGGLGDNDRLVVNYTDATGAVTGDSSANFTDAGGSGSVTINGGFENFTVNTGDFADTLTTGAGDDVVNAGNGANTVTVGEGVNRIIGGADTDTFTGLNGGNYMDGGDGANTMTSGSGNDTILSGTGTDVIKTGAGNDIITARAGADDVEAGAGDDRLVVEYGDMVTDVTTVFSGDLAAGYTGQIADGSGNLVDFDGVENFTVATGSGNDVITTGDGADVITTGSGNDALTGGGGNDTLDGGAGTADVAEYSGDFADYTITAVGQSFQIVDNRIGSADGTDIVSGVENFSFADGIVPAAPSDTPGPTGTVTLSDPALTAGDTTTVTVAFSEAVTGFTNADLTVENGTLSAVSSLDGGVTWAATFTPTAGTIDAENVITLNQEGVTDISGNAGTGTVTSANYTVDTARPTGTVTLGDPALAAGETSTVTIAFSEAVTGFTNADLMVENGNLSNVSSVDGGVTWAATFTPTAGTTDAENVITLSQAGVTDASGNVGTGTASSANYTIDTVRPTATITLDDVALRAGETSTVTIAFSEAVAGLTNADLAVENGTLSAVSSINGGVTWTATFTPITGTTDAENVITLNQSGVTDASGNAGNGTASSANYTVDTAGPTGTITMSDTALLAGETSTVTITFGEAVTNFAAADLTVANGTVSEPIASSDGLSWTATFTPSANIDDTSNVITLNQAGLTDASGNAGTGTATSANYTVDSARPTGTVTLSDRALTAGETSTVTIAFGEAVTGFTAADLTVENGTLSHPVASSDGISWTATFTPSADITDTTNVITLNQAGVTDASGNAGAGNVASANYTVDTAQAPPPPPPPSGGTGNDGEDAISGGSGPDGLTGGLSNDTVSGGAGNDVVYGNQGQDALSGDAGNDTIFGGQDNDTIYGGSSGEDSADDADVLYGNKGDDVVFGNGGDDTIFGGEGADTAFGGQGNDLIFGRDAEVGALDGADELTGGLGNDTVYGNAGDDVLFGNQSNDELFGGQGSDTVYGGQDNDTIYGGSSGQDSADDADVLYGNKGDDVVFGNGGDDTIFGGEGADTAFGGHGNDLIFGRDAEVGALDGADELTGGLGNDTVYGNAGDDVLLGNQNNDELFGGQGNDTLCGGQNDDTLNGGAGDDALLGGLGGDIFVFASAQGNDIIADFDFDQGDRLDLQGQDYSVAEVDGSSVLTLSDGGTIVLQGVTGDEFASNYLV
jgi:Ca2+-binding RTX toxin-like protein